MYECVCGGGMRGFAQALVTVSDLGRFGCIQRTSKLPVSKGTHITHWVVKPAATVREHTPLAAPAATGTVPIGCFAEETTALVPRACTECVDGG
jgi:hypothetical protein